MLGRSYTRLILKRPPTELVAEAPLAQLMANPGAIIRMNASPIPARPSRTLHTHSTRQAGETNDGLHLVPSRKKGNNGSVGSCECTDRPPLTPIAPLLTCQFEG